ncbi:hypothetical protein PG994_008936 [Apiospora phragmitis]|uniref:Uncharacterized protein n=1 Tax=Apiospora phragmitis TaxID=2905665 RepID=A0ABR1UKR7_9PEZI
MTPPLPLKIWGVVCEQLADENFRKPGDPTGMLTRNPADGRRTLLALCEVSRGIAQVAQPVLFRTYDFDDGRNDGKRHLRFLRSILDNQRLASYVQAVILAHWINEIDADELAEVYSRIAARLGFDTGEHGPEDGIGIPERIPAILLLLLPLLPNLKCLAVTTRHEEHALELLGRLHQAGVIEPFASVVHLGLRHGDTEMGFDLLANSPLLALTPNATTLRLNQCRGVSSHEGDDDDGKVAQDMLQRCMPRGIKNLDLDYCNLEHLDVKALLACCPLLERFRYWSGGACVHEANREVRNRQLVASLAPAKATLRRVELDFGMSDREPDDSDDDGDDDEDEDEDEEVDKDELTQESFADFPVLERVVYEGRVIFRIQSRLGDDGDNDVGSEEDEDGDESDE